MENNLNDQQFYVLKSTTGDVNDSDWELVTSIYGTETEAKKATDQALEDNRYELDTHDQLIVALSHYNLSKFQKIDEEFYMEGTIEIVTKLENLILYQVEATKN